MLNNSVTLMITRVPKSGCERDWELAVKEIVRAAGNCPGGLGTTVIKPREGILEAYQIIVKFDSTENFRIWEMSKEREELLRKLECMESEPVKYGHDTGLETWFELPESAGLRQPMVPPQRFKMMVVSGMGVYLTITPLLYALGSWLQLLPVYLSTMVLVAITVMLLTYVVMPAMTRIFRTWLYGSVI